MTREPKQPVLNAISVDVEEHFQVTGFEGVVSRDAWDRSPSRVEDNTSRLLDLFDELEVSATFFVLGWVAERHPGLVRRIAERGHEIGSHGYSHKLVYTQDPEEFRQETARSRQILQDASGQRIDGYRAATFSITGRNLWALDILAETGFAYDSSLFPVVHDRYGVPGAPRNIHRLRTPGGMTLVEVPPSTLALGRAIVPVAGGGYLRLYPGPITHWAIARLNDREGIPAIVYLHPWEVDPGQGRIRGSWINRFRHYYGLKSTDRKLRALARRFRFGPVERVIEEYLPAESPISGVEDAGGNAPGVPSGDGGGSHC
jgi:polysaccharide deacetylase family protein (PEP-CTERM system associated)